MSMTIKRLLVWAAIIALILLIPFLIMQFDIKAYDPGSGYAQINWTTFDFVILGVALSIIALAYEIIARRIASPTYRLAFGAGLVSAFLLFLTNGAVGMIGDEDQAANVLYMAVFAVGLIGSLVARFKPRGMAMTLFTAAGVTVLIPVIALTIWPQISWGEAGVIKTLGANTLFALLFSASGLLFQRATRV